MSSLANAGSLCVGVQPRHTTVASFIPQTPALATSRTRTQPSRLSLRGGRSLTRRPATLVSASALGPQGDGNVKAVESKEEFENYLKEALDRLVVLDIATKTCGPCKFIYPKVVQLSLDHPDIVFLKIFGDANEGTRALMREWGVRAVPSFRFYKNGELIHTHSGAKEEDLRSNIAKFAPQVAKA